MLLGVKGIKQVVLRHLSVFFVSALLVYLVWSINDTWSPDMRLWKAFGGASFFLLWFTLFIGPASRIWPALEKILAFRRETGIWFFLLILIHAYLILDGWVRWGGVGVFGLPVCGRF